MSDIVEAKQVDWGLPFGVWAVAAPTLVGTWVAIGVHWAVWAATLLWLILWLTALLKMLAPEPRAFLAGTLRKSTFTQVYTWAVKPRLDRLWNSLCDPVDSRDSLPALFRAGLTWKLYDRALLIAVAYPILLLTGQWAAGWDGKLGEAVILPAAPWWPDRAVTIGGIALILLSLPASRLASASGRVFLRKVSGWLPILAFAFAFAFAGAFAVAVAAAGALAFAVPGAFAGAVALAGAFAVAVAGAFAGAGAFAVAGAFAGAFAVAGAVEYLDSRARPALARRLLTAVVPLFWLSALLLIPWESLEADQRGIFLFLGVLPLLNALFDVTSYATTLSLMRRGFASAWPWLWGAVDFAVALVLFLALGATLTAVIAAMNALAGTSIFDLSSLFDGIETQPNAYWWLYAMVFSTILPTALHFAVSLIGFQGLTPRPIRRYAAGLLDAAPTSPPAAATAPILLGTIWLVPFLAVGGVIWGLWRWVWLGDAVTWLGQAYFAALKGLAAALGAI